MELNSVVQSRTFAGHFIITNEDGTANHFGIFDSRLLNPTAAYIDIGREGYKLLIGKHEAYLDWDRDTVAYPPSDLNAVHITHQDTGAHGWVFRSDVVIVNDSTTAPAQKTIFTDITRANSNKVGSTSSVITQADTTAHAPSFSITKGPYNPIIASNIALVLKNLVHRDLYINITKVRMREEMHDASIDYEDVEFNILAGGARVDKSFYIQLDPYETREYNVLILKECSNYLDFEVFATAREKKSTPVFCEVALRDFNRVPKTEVIVPPVHSSTSHVETCVKNLKIGEKYYLSRQKEDDSNGKGLEIYYERVTVAELQQYFRNRYPAHGGGKNCLDGNAPVSAKTYGTTCPSCENNLEELMRYTSSDGFMGIFRDRWACPNENCCTIRECSFEGYGEV